jgi:CRP/FNR family transcriptional regulator
MTPEAASIASRLERMVPGLSKLPPRTLAGLGAAAVALERDAGTMLFDDGSPCAGMLLLESGGVRVSMASAGGREILLYRVRPGETCVLTLGCLLGRDDYPARGVAESAIRGVFLPAEWFERLLEDSPEFRRFVFSAFSARLRDVLSLTSAVAFDRLDARLAAALLGRAERAGSVELAVTHQQLADELGCAREAVSRLLEGFESAGAIELGRGHVVLRDKELLGHAPPGGR